MRVEKCSEVEVRILQTGVGVCPCVYVCTHVCVCVWACGCVCVCGMGVCFAFSSVRGSLAFSFCV